MKYIKTFEDFIKEPKRFCGKCKKEVNILNLRAIKISGMYHELCPNCANIIDRKNKLEKLNKL